MYWSVVEPDQGNGERKFSLIYDEGKHSKGRRYLIVLSHIISQLRPGADLSRVVLPTFILEPRSMLERITKCVLDICLLAGRSLIRCQLHGSPRNAPTYAEDRRSNREIRFSGEVLFKWVAHQTSVRLIRCLLNPRHLYVD